MTVFYGKYRGKVTDIDDPLFMGRIRAKVPDVLGDDESGWALPCAPFGGANMGMFVLPTVDASVWIEFEHGDPDYPIWTGCFWASATDRPSDLMSPPYKKVLLQTDGGNKVTLDDTPGMGGITLETSGGQKITMTSISIEIDNGQGATLKLGPGGMVAINDDALKVLY
jgi:uncharacterized protein involved in type VI secretion and phage assembly